MMRRIRWPIGIGPQPVLGRVVRATSSGRVVHRLGANRFPSLDLQSGAAQPAGQLPGGHGNHDPFTGVTYFDLNGDAARLGRRPARCEPFRDLLQADLQAVALTARQPQRDVLQVMRFV
jgi:hypothetical protein